MEARGLNGDSSDKAGSQICGKEFLCGPGLAKGMGYVSGQKAERAVPCAALIYKRVARGTHALFVPLAQILAQLAQVIKVQGGCMRIHVEHFTGVLRLWKSSASAYGLRAST